MKLLLSIFFLFIYFVNIAQTASVQGKVVDKYNRGFSDARIYITENKKLNTLSNLDGFYTLSVPANQEITLVVLYSSERFEYKINLKPGENYELPKTKFSLQSNEGVVITGSGSSDIGNIEKIDLLNIAGPSQSVERFLTFSTAATSNNELTNNYNVRGGNFDENLIYLNGFQVYRPFLTRAGQQEGMSFINTDMVENIAFSAGGFTANYGDKLSSVLDITYKTPDSLIGSGSASLLGVSANIGHKVSPRFNFLAGARYRSNGYLLNALPTQGAYNPIFYDFQFLTNYTISDRLVWSVLGHFSSNNYRFAPETQETQFGTVNEAYSFRVFFDGQEQTRFRTITGATSLKFKANKRTNLDFYASIFNTDESENFTIQGQYFINELETDPGQEEFGDSVGTIGVGTFLNHARNNLNATIYALSHDGQYQFQEIDNTGLDYLKKGKLRWGIRAQYEDFYDQLSEWKLVDSAGFSLPQNPGGNLELSETIKAINTLQSSRYSAYVMFSRNWQKDSLSYPAEIVLRSKDSLGKTVKTRIIDTVENSRQNFKFDGGIRAGYTAFNNEFYITPRAGISFYPRKYYQRNGINKKRFMRYHASTGLYYQPPFYRELRAFDGTVNTSIKSQKSFHLVAGLDYQFEMWGREKPFKLTSEVYYKYLWDVNPYEIDNVRVRYYTTNDAIAYAYGLDLNLHGEFIEGIQSFFKFSALRTAEDLLSDEFYIYLNSDNDTIINGFTFNDVATDSIRQEPGFIPRPSDQWFTFATLFQDRMPRFPKFTVNLGLNYGYKLPYGPPDFNRYKDILRQRAYFRTDIGFGYDFLYEKSFENRNKLGRALTDARLSFELFNLLGINNVLSQQWIQDVEGRFYGIPNFLTGRRFNVKLVVTF